MVKRQNFRRRRARAQLTLRDLFEFMGLPAPQDHSTPIRVLAEVVMNGAPPLSYRYEGEVLVIDIQYEEMLYDNEGEFPCRKLSPNTD